ARMFRQRGDILMIRPLASITIFLSVLLTAAEGFAQPPTSRNSEYPIQIGAEGPKTPVISHLRYLTLDLFPPDTKAALNHEAEAALSANASATETASTIVSVPRWSGAFAF